MATIGPYKDEVNLNCELKLCSACVSKVAVID